jgi:spermidine synthase
VFKSTSFGNVLVLDGVIQLTDRDEAAYQEMIAHLPLYSHANPEHVLIIGGGDGGVIREVVKHSSVKSITICEIDQVVIDAGKKYFPSVASAWADPRVTLHCGDGAVFLAKPENLGKYDVIITDSSDPVGPAASLFESPFYQAMNNALKDGGKVCTQAESMWLHLDLISKLVKDSSHTFANVEYATTQIPTYPAGQIGLLLCSKQTTGKKAPTCVKPARKVTSKDADNFKYYTSALHEAAFVLPRFVQKRVDEAKATAKAEKDEAKANAKKAGKRKSQAPAEDEEKDAKLQKTEEEPAAATEDATTA